MPRVSPSTASSCASSRSAEPRRGTGRARPGAPPRPGRAAPRPSARPRGPRWPRGSARAPRRGSPARRRPRRGGRRVPASANARRSSMSRRVTPGMLPTAGSTSRGTAMSTISSGRPVAAIDDGADVVDLEQRRRTRRWTTAARRRRRGRRARRAGARPGRRRGRRARRPAPTCGWPAPRSAAPALASAEGHGLAHLAGAEHEDALAVEAAEALRRPWRPRPATPTWCCGRWPVSVRARLPTSRAWRNRRLSAGPAAPSSRARSHASRHLAEDLALAEHGASRARRPPRRGGPRRARRSGRRGGR